MILDIFILRVRKKEGEEKAGGFCFKAVVIEGCLSSIYD